MSSNIWAIFSDQQIGRTKVFLRAGQMAELDARRTEVRNTAARGVQSQFRSHVAREQFLMRRNASVCLQSFVRGKLISERHLNWKYVVIVAMEPYAYFKSSFAYCSKIGL